MNNGLKREIKEAFEMKEPEGKEQFLKNLCFPKISRRDFIFEQIFYIRKKVWLFSFLIVGLIMFTVYSFGRFSSSNINLWIISSLMPFLALISIVELSRSSMFKMAEMEAGCLFGLPQLLLARMLILGVWNGLLFIVIVMAVNMYMPTGIIKIVVYLLAPYLLVCGISFYLINKGKERSEVYSCTAIAVLLSVCLIMMQRILKNYNEQIGIWIMLTFFVIGLCMISVQTKKFKEEYVLNLF
ncbi:MAG: hypothetical protein K2K54_13600 [Lachnospiraceae bacterium]|nr:hypothetical protein [Lachnospiraceae bacterium]